MRTFQESARQRHAGRVHRRRAPAFDESAQLRVRCGLADIGHHELGIRRYETIGSRRGRERRGGHRQHAKKPCWTPSHGSSAGMRAANVAGSSASCWMVHPLIVVGTSASALAKVSSAMDLIELFFAFTATAKLRMVTAPSGSATRMAMIAVPVVASSGVSVNVRVAPLPESATPSAGNTAVPSAAAVTIKLLAPD